MGWKVAAAEGPEAVESFAKRARRKQRPLRFSSASASALSLRATPLASGAFLPGLGIRSSLPAGIMPSAVVVGDFNKDGKLDVAVTAYTLSVPNSYYAANITAYVNVLVGNGADGFSAFLKSFFARELATSALRSAAVGK